MPVSIDPQPAENEIECGRCGAYFYYELTRCPHCGVNVYEPDDNDRGQSAPQLVRPPLAHENKLGALIRRLTKKPYPVDELFGASINQAGLFNDLLTKVAGDRAAAERLIAFERQKYPQGNRGVWLENAIQRLENDNRTPGSDPEQGSS
ncbi:MAG: hypothetical protein WCE68_18580 [Anaerolineales bacterium]